MDRNAYRTGRLLCRVAALAIACVVLVGCSAKTIYLQRPPDAAAVTPTQSAGQPADAVAVLVACNATYNGVAQPASRGFQERVLSKLLDTKLFGSVTVGESSASRAVKLSLSVEEREDYHSGWNTVRAFFGCLPLYLASPCLKLKHDFSSTMTLDVVRPDGASKRYTATTVAQSKRYAFADPKKVLDAFTDEVTFSSLNSLMNQLIADGQWSVPKPVVPKK